MLFFLLSCQNIENKAMTTGEENSIIAPLNIAPSIHDTQIETVKRIRWAGELGDILKYIDASGNTREVISEGNAQHREALLFGVAQFSSVDIQIGRNVNGEWLYNESTSVQIGRLTSELPELDLVVPGDWDGTILFPIIGDQQENIAMINPAGEIIWAIGQQSHPEIFANGTMIQSSFSKDGNSILLLNSASSFGKDGAIYKVGLDGRLLEKIIIDGAHLSFVEADIDHYFLLSYNDEGILGDNEPPTTSDVILEIKDGLSREVWNFWSTTFR